jgi:hypothetical protein
MASKQRIVLLGRFCEDPQNVSEATDEEINRLAGKLKRVPLGLTAMRIAYVTDAMPGKFMVISGNKRLRVLKQAYGEDGEVPAEWFQDVTAMSEAERHEFRLNANISDGHFNLEKLLDQYGRDELSAAGLDDLLSNLPLDDGGKDEAEGESRKGNLEARFGVVPFSVLYATRDNWVKRKTDWLALGIRSELGRGGGLLQMEGAIARQGEYKQGDGYAISFNNQHKLWEYQKDGKRRKRAGAAGGLTFGNCAQW